MTDVEDRVDRLLSRAEDGFDRLREPRATVDEIAETLDDLEDVADEAEDVLSEADLLQVLRTVDWDDVPEAVDPEDAPAAVEEGDPSEVVTLRKLLDLTDLPELWRSVNARALWREEREFEDALDDLVGEDEASEDEFADVSIPDVGSGPSVDPESMEHAIQSKVGDSVDEFRATLLAAHDRLAALYEYNQERFSDRRSEDSRNPSEHSTMPSNRPELGGVRRPSSVPSETRHSSVPNRDRIYGARFDDGGADDA